MKRKLMCLMGLLVIVMVGGCGSKTEDNGAKGSDMLSVDTYTPVLDEEGKELDCGNLAVDGIVDLNKIYEETEAVVISMVWDVDGFDNTCEPCFDMQYASEAPALTGYGYGTGYYDENGETILINFYEEHDGKAFDTVLVLAKENVSVSLEPSFPSNDSPLQGAVIQIADANGARTLEADEICTRGETGIWYDAICTIKNGLAEEYEF